MTSIARATEIVASLKTGDSSAAKELLPLVYDHLHAVAMNYLHHQRRDHTLQPTALVHEAYLKMVDQTNTKYADEAHFCAVAATAMRQILINYAEHRAAKKRGGDRRRFSFNNDDLIPVSEESCDDLLALNDSLNRLAKRDDRKARVVDMRFFGGLTMEQIACVLNVSQSTVESDWRLARAWLSKDLS